MTAVAHRAWPGILSFTLAIATVVAVVVGIVLATSDLYLAATCTAWGAVAASALAIVAGIVAVAARSGRGWGAAGLVLGVVANPVVLTRTLGLIGGLWT